MSNQDAGVLPPFRKGSYFAGYLRKNGAPPPTAGERDKLINDRAAYISFLEASLEKAAAACVHADTLADKMLVTERIVSEQCKLVTELQSQVGNLQEYSERQGSEAGEAVARHTIVLQELSSRYDRQSDRLHDLAEKNAQLNSKVEALLQALETERGMREKLQVDYDTLAMQQSKVLSRLETLEQESLRKSDSVAVFAAIDRQDKKHQDLCNVVNALQNKVDTVRAAAEQAATTATSAEAASIAASQSANTAAMTAASSLEKCEKATQKANDAATQASIAECITRGALKHLSQSTSLPRTNYSNPPSSGPAGPAGSANAVPASSAPPHDPLRAVHAAIQEIESSVRKLHPQASESDRASLFSLGSGNDKVPQSILNSLTNSSVISSHILEAIVSSTLRPCLDTFLGQFQSFSHALQEVWAVLHPANQSVRAVETRLATVEGDLANLSDTIQSDKQQQRARHASLEKYAENTHELLLKELQDVRGSVEQELGKALDQLTEIRSKERGDDVDRVRNAVERWLQLKFPTLLLDTPEYSRLSNAMEEVKSLSSLVNQLSSEFSALMDTMTAFRKDHESFARKVKEKYADTKQLGSSLKRSLEKDFRDLVAKEVDKASEKFHDDVSSVKDSLSEKVESVSSEVADISKHLSNAIQHINQIVGEMDQRNLKSMEEANTLDAIAQRTAVGKEQLSQAVSDTFEFSRQGFLRVSADLERILQRVDSMEHVLADSRLSYSGHVIPSITPPALNHSVSTYESHSPSYQTYSNPFASSHSNAYATGPMQGFSSRDFAAGDLSTTQTMSLGSTHPENPFNTPAAARNYAVYSLATGHAAYSPIAIAAGGTEAIHYSPGTGKAAHAEPMQPQIPPSRSITPSPHLGSRSQTHNDTQTTMVFGSAKKRNVVPTSTSDVSTTLHSSGHLVSPQATLRSSATPSFASFSVGVPATKASTPSRTRPQLRSHALSTALGWLPESGETSTPPRSVSVDGTTRRLKKSPLTLASKSAQASPFSRSMSASVLMKPAFPSFPPFTPPEEEERAAAGMSFGTTALESGLVHPLTSFPNLAQPAFVTQTMEPHTMQFSRISEPTWQSSAMNCTDYESHASRKRDHQQFEAASPATFQVGVSSSSITHAFPSAQIDKSPKSSHELESFLRDRLKGLSLRPVPPSCLSPPSAAPNLSASTSVAPSGTSSVALSSIAPSSVPSSACPSRQTTPESIRSAQRYSTQGPSAPPSRSASVSRADTSASTPTQLKAFLETSSAPAVEALSRSSSVASASMASSSSFANSSTTTSSIANKSGSSTVRSGVDVMDLSIPSRRSSLGEIPSRRELAQEKERTASVSSYTSDFTSSHSISSMPPQSLPGSTFPQENEEQAYSLDFSEGQGKA